MSWRDDVVKEAMTWEGTPHRHEAMVKGVGVDCARILIAVYEATGVMPKGECRPPHYPQDYHLHKDPKYLEWVLKYCDKVEEALPGDIAVFHFGRGISHGGIVLEWPIIIHAYTSLGVIRSSVEESLLLERNGKTRLRGIYRPKGCE
jgi:cell wall-associated NlpC family hydrolase